MADTEILKQMGNRIFLRRKFMRITQEQLAERMGVSTQMISNLESGKKAIRPENLIKICSVLNISADYVLTGHNSNSTLSRITEKLGSLSAEELELIEKTIDYMSKKQPF